MRTRYAFCDLDTYLRVHILLDIRRKDLPDDTSVLELHEDKWITLSRTKAPQGINNLIKDFAHTFYSYFFLKKSIFQKKCYILSSRDSVLNC